MARETQKIIVMGLGYIGLPTASMLATKGHQVLGVDVSQKAVDTINSGHIHIVEPDLDILVRSAVNSGNLRAAMMPEEGRHLYLWRCPHRSGSLQATPKRRTSAMSRPRPAPSRRGCERTTWSFWSPPRRWGPPRVVERIIAELRPELRGQGAYRALPRARLARPNPARTG